MSPSSRRTSAVPNEQGDKALYSIITQTPGIPSTITETRISNLQTGTSTRFFKGAYDREAIWLGIENLVIWLKDVPLKATEIWIADAVESQANYCAGRLAALASHLKVKRLRNEYDDIAIAVAGPATKARNPYNPEADLTKGADGIHSNAIWYTTLRKKAIDNHSEAMRYLLSPTKWINALRGTGLESPLPALLGPADDFDISSSGIVFIAKDPTGNLGGFPSVETYYIPLKTFTELSNPRPQRIKVKDYNGTSSNPVFSQNGDSVAFLKKKSPTDKNDRNRVIVISRIRDFRAHVSIEDIPTRQSEKEWHLSPFSVAWSDNGKELYVVAIDRGMRKLFKIPAALSSIKQEPEPITSESTMPADVRHLRMVFSAPLESSYS